MPDADQITVYADYVCPFCYLGRQSLADYRATRSAPLEVEWQPFDLRADQRGDDGQLAEGTASGKDEAYYERARENVKRLAAEYDVEMAQTLVRDVDSRTAQIASFAVQLDRPEFWDDFDRGVYDALWRENRDIGDPDVIAAVAADVGLDPDWARSTLTDDAVQRRLEDQWEAARVRGITGVPTFVAGGKTARGAIPSAQFEALLED